MRISIKDKIGPRCIIKEDGQKVYDAIHGKLRNGETVTLDFAGVRQFASPFFNFAIGQLLQDITEDDLRRLLKIENLTRPAVWWLNESSKTPPNTMATRITAKSSTKF